MFRSTVRAYYKIRYFPRRVFEILGEISAGVSRLNQTRQENYLRNSAALEDIHADITAFCSDATLMMLNLQRSLLETKRQIDSVSRAASRNEEFGAEIVAELRRVENMEASLSAVARTVGTLAETASGLGGTVNGLQQRVARLAANTDDHSTAMTTATSAIGKVEAELRQQASAIADLQRTVSRQGLVFPSSIWTTGSSARVRSILSLLEPRSVAGVEKVRVGRDADGGYVMLDAFADVVAALSLGIADDVSWDTDIAARGIEVFQFDPTVQSGPADNARFHFEPLKIAPNDGTGAISIDTILATRTPDGGDRLLLKIDIEGAEWEVFETVPEPSLGRFRQIVCEFHALDRLGETEFGDRAREVFRKLNRTHFVCHVHGNNCSNFANVANVMVPQVLEVTFANRAHFTPVEADEVYPTPLDRANEKGRADLYLGRFRFDGWSEAAE